VRQSGGERAGVLIRRLPEKDERAEEISQNFSLGNSDMSNKWLSKRSLPLIFLTRMISF